MRSLQITYNGNVTYWHFDKMVDTFLMIFTDAFSGINFVLWFKCPWSLLLVSSWWYILIGSNTNLMQIRWYVITWTNVDRGHWCMYASSAINVFKELDAVIENALIFIERHCTAFLYWCSGLFSFKTSWMKPTVLLKSVIPGQKFNIQNDMIGIENNTLWMWMWCERLYLTKISFVYIISSRIWGIRYKILPPA